MRPTFGGFMERPHIHVAVASHPGEAASSTCQWKQPSARAVLAKPNGRAVRAAVIKTDYRFAKQASEDKIEP
jgi:hypothetical protein